jgi:molecular chaperone GrpE
MDEENDDITLDSDSDIDDSVLADEAKEDTIKKLKEKVKNAEAKAKEYLDSWQRAQADFANLRKRDESQKTEFLKYASGDVLLDLLPVLDSLNLALEHGHKEIEPVKGQLLQILKNRGLKEIDSMGEIFDPRYHEAVGSIETDKKEDDHKILEVFQKGYLLDDRVLRPAKVRIGDYKG